MMLKTQRTICLAAGTAVLAGFLLAAVCAPALAPYPLDKSHIPFLAVSRTHFLGTNDMGIDIFTELIHAGRVSLSIGILASVISVVIGGGIGIAAGYFRGFSGEIFTGIIDIFLLIPMLPFMVVLTAYFGQSLVNLVLAIGLLGWCSMARAVRAKVLRLRETLFVEALKGMGIRTRRILTDHMLPHVLDIISAKFVLSVAGAMLSEAALSFLGLGDPAVVSWGMMIHHAFKRGGFSNGMWYWYLPPGLCIGLCVFGFTLIGLYFEQSHKKETPGLLIE